LLTAERNLGDAKSAQAARLVKVRGGQEPTAIAPSHAEADSPHQPRTELPNEENPNLPSATRISCSYRHDMVNTSISLAATDGPPLLDSKMPGGSATLDTIYGRRPDVSPQAYEFSQICKESRGLMPRTRLRRGRVQNRSGSTARMPFADIAARADRCCRRRESVIVQGPLGVHLPRRLWPTHANEDQALIVQITVLFHRLHNFILDQIDSSVDPKLLTMPIGISSPRRFL